MELLIEIALWVTSGFVLGWLLAMWIYGKWIGIDEALLGKPRDNRHDHSSRRWRG